MTHPQRLGVADRKPSELKRKPTYCRRLRRSSDSSARLHLKPAWHFNPAKSSSCEMRNGSVTLGPGVPHDRYGHTGRQHQGLHADS